MACAGWISHYDGVRFFQGKLNKTLRAGIYAFTAMNWVSTVGYALFPLTASGICGIVPGCYAVYVVTVRLCFFPLHLDIDYGGRISKRVVIDLWRFGRRSRLPQCSWARLERIWFRMSILALSNVSACSLRLGSTPFWECIYSTAWYETEPLEKA